MCRPIADCKVGGSPAARLELPSRADASKASGVLVKANSKRGTLMGRNRRAGPERLRGAARGGRHGQRASPAPETREASARRQDLLQDWTAIAHTARHWSACLAWRPRGLSRFRRVGCRCSRESLYRVLSHDARSASSCPHSVMVWREACPHVQR